MDYNKTLNLPATDFPMRASLPQREPSMLDAWNDAGVYAKLLELNKDKPAYVLHDGPPFSISSFRTDFQAQLLPQR